MPLLPEADFFAQFEIFSIRFFVGEGGGIKKLKSLWDFSALVNGGVYEILFFFNYLVHKICVLVT